MKRLISRFSFSLIAIGLVLAYTGYQTQMTGGGLARVVIYYIAATACFGLGLYGLAGRYGSEQ